MANNLYVSPRSYAQNQRKRVKKAGTEMGIGYVIPDGVSKSDFRKLYAEWEAKLAASGFEDLEYRAPAQTGKFSPYFKRNGSTATFQMIYDSAAEEYYSLARSFDAHMNVKLSNGHTRWAKYFRGKSEMYRLLWSMHIEGVPYRAMAKEFAGIATEWRSDIKRVPKHLRTRKTEFWTHNHVHKILDLFWKWAKPKGLKDPRNLKAAGTYKPNE